MRVYVVSLIGASGATLEVQVRRSIEGVIDALFGIDMRLGLAVTMLTRAHEDILAANDGAIIGLSATANRPECVMVTRCDVRS